MTVETGTKPYRLRLAELDAEFDSNWRSHYLDLATYEMPRLGRYLQSKDSYQDNRGNKINDKIINDVIFDSVRTLVGGMVGGNSSPAREWFRLAMADDELMENEEVKSWLHDVRRMMLGIFQKSDLYNVLGNIEYEVAIFGTAVLLIEEDFETGLYFRPLTAGEYRLAAGKNNKIDTLYRRFSLTARQMVAEFGADRVSLAVNEAIKNDKGETRFMVIHAIQPRKIFNPTKKDPKNMPFESVYFQEVQGDGEDKFLRESGYSTIPFAALRWSVCGSDVYGRSPGMDALPDVKQLQLLEQRKLQGLDKLIAPPMTAPSSLKNHGLPNLLPGGITYVDSSAAGSGVQPAYQVNLNLQDIEYSISQVEKRIRRAFYNDLFLAAIRTDKEMTAREVAERHEEKMVMLGPPSERQQVELHNVVIERSFAVTNNLGMIPPPPKIMQGKELKIEYISMLASAQRMAGMSGLQDIMAFTANLSPLKPEMLDKLDFDEAIDQYGDALGVPPKIIVPDDNVAKIRQARAEQQQKAQQAQSAMAAAQTAQTLAQTPMDQNTALDGIMGRRRASA